MKYIKLFEEFTEPKFLTDPNKIKKWLDIHGVKDMDLFEVTENGIVNSPVEVLLTSQSFTHFPFKFGKVAEYFTCWNCPNLTSLKGCPTEVGGWFDCSGCTNLTNFYYAPKKPYSYDYCKCTNTYESLGYNEENHKGAGIHLKVALELNNQEDFIDILEHAPMEKISKTIIDYPDLADPIMDSNLSQDIKSELKYAINLSKSDVKAKNLFD